MYIKENRVLRSGRDSSALGQDPMAACGGHGNGPFQIPYKAENSRTSKAIRPISFP